LGVKSKQEILAWEARWAMPAALATLAAVGFVIAAILVVNQGTGSGDGDAALLRDVQQHRSDRLLSSILQAIGVGLLAAPLYFLFRAAQWRNPNMSGQMVGIVVIAPLFLAALAIFSSLTTLHAASDFVAMGISGTGDRANDAAQDALNDAPLRPFALGFGIAGPLGFVIAMFYTAMQAMRAGLLTRFWGSLGMALGAVSFIFFQFALLWFVYLGILLIGRVPGGKPPAWAAAEAIPWPTPGEKAAAEIAPPQAPEELEPSDSGEPSEPRRKRKQRD
jgi:hypothetical protein